MYIIKLKLALRLILTLSLIFSITNVFAENTPEVTFHYGGDINITPEEGYIDAQWQISVFPNTVEDLTFVIRSTLKNVTVTGAMVKGFSVSESKLGTDFQQINIQLDNRAGTKPRMFNLSYSGVLLPTPMKNGINQISKDIVELNVDSFWLPMDSQFNKLMTTDININIGSGWQAVAAGDITKTNEQQFRLVNNTPSLDIAFAMATNYRVSHHNGFHLYDTRPSDAGITRLVEAVEFCVSGLNQKFGQQEPLNDIYFTINQRKESGYARGNYIALTEIANAKETRLTQFVCHEIAHYWSRGGKFDTVENWLNEAFAEYVGMMMLRERFGDEAFSKRIAGFEKQIEGKSLGPIWLPSKTERPAYLVSYRKGPLALYQLEQKIGQKPFANWLEIYMTNRLTSTPALLEALRKVTDDNTVAWFTTILAE